MLSSIKNIKPIKTGIFFQFLDKTAGGVFTRNSTNSNIIQVSSFNDQHGSRFGRVVGKGPDVSTNIQVGDIVLIEDGKWTMQIWLDDGNKIWKSEEKFVVATTM